MARIVALVGRIDLRDVAGLAGAGLTVYGVALMHVPSAFIVSGVELLAFTIIAARR